MRRTARDCIIQSCHLIPSSASRSDTSELCHTQRLVKKGCVFQHSISSCCVSFSPLCDWNIIIQPCAHNIRFQVSKPLKRVLIAPSTITHQHSITWVVSIRRVKRPFSRPALRKTHNRSRWHKLRRFLQIRRAWHKMKILPCLVINQVAKLPWVVSHNLSN